MTEERLKAITHPSPLEAELVAEVRRRNKEAGMWEGAAKLALERAEVAQKQRDAARAAIRKALHSGQVGQDAAAMLLEALSR